MRLGIFILDTGRRISGTFVLDRNYIVGTFAPNEDGLQSSLSDLDDLPLSDGTLGYFDEWSLLGMQLPQ